ncbi:MAG: maleylacetoacetate isomerase [Undibacterium sp.]|nr:maleylacetoacetate isomerase [Undibacterium sp.]
MKLYGYFRSSASYRVRIALNLKGLVHEHVAVHLLKDGGQQFSAPFKQLNPDSLIPVLCDEDEGEELVLSQSLAILEYLDEKYPETSLLPSKRSDRAYVRALSLAIACDIHPINNLRVLKYLTAHFSVTEEQKTDWYKHWCMLGLSQLEQRLVTDARSGDFCFGDAPSMADCCLVPQVFNALRFNCDLSLLPKTMGIYQRCLELEAFSQAAPSAQPDAE